MLACFIKDDRSRRWRLTDKFDDWVGHLNTILAPGGGNFNDPIFKSLNAQALPGGEGKLKFRVNGRIIFGKGGKNFKTRLNCRCKPRE